eukprot:5821312-Pyramimonas_sp.AAC.3
MKGSFANGERCGIDRTNSVRGSSWTTHGRLDWSIGPFASGRAWGLPVAAAAAAAAAADAVAVAAADVADAAVVVADTVADTAAAAAAANAVVSNRVTASRNDRLQRGQH